MWNMIDRRMDKYNIELVRNLQYEYKKIQKMSEKINELIIHVKEYLHLGQKQSQQSIRQIQNQIDDKNMQIRDIFKSNLNQVINHYIKYQEIASNQRRIQNHCEEFSKRIQRAHNLSQYDEKMIERGQKGILALRAKKKQLQTFRQKVRNLKKAAINIQQQRYSQAIKQLNIYRQKQPEIDTPLKKTTKLFNQQIKNHLVKLVSNFWQINNAKICDIGSHCYNKIQLSTHQKTNIYQSFFGRNSVARNSLIRKSSIIDQGKGEAPLRFLKKIKKEQILQKFILRINVQMNSLKQTRMLCKQMKQQQLFQDIINKQVRRVIGDIAKNTPCDNQMDLKKLLSNYIGFLLFRREIIAFFNIENEQKVVLTQMYSLIGQQAKSLVSRPQNTSQILKIKSMLDIFYKVLEIVDLDSKASQFSIVIGQIFKIYCAYSLQQYESILSEQINEDNFISFSTDDDYEKKMIIEILGLKTTKGQQSYNFTKFVMYVLQIFNQYYDRMVAFVKDTDLNKSLLHDHLSALFQRIVAVYGGLLVVKDSPLQIAQGETNLHYCQTIFRFFSQQLQTKHEYMRMNDFSYKAKLQSVIVELRRRMRELVEQKISALMPNYQHSNINDVAYQKSNQYLPWVFEFIQSMVNQLRRANNPTHEEMVFTWIGHIANLYWDFLEECKQFNLLTIYNLDLDLLSIYKIINQNFSIYPGLSEKFKSLNQFYSLLLINNIQEVVQKNKRDIAYSHLDFQQIIPILKKYNKAKNNGNGKIRDLKKKDIETIVKKLQIDYK